MPWNLQKFLCQHCSKLLLKCRLSQPLCMIVAKNVDRRSQKPQNMTSTCAVLDCYQRGDIFKNCDWWWNIDFIRQCQVQTTIHAVTSFQIQKDKNVQSNSCIKDYGNTVLGSKRRTFDGLHGAWNNNTLQVYCEIFSEI